MRFAAFSIFTVAFVSTLSICGEISANMCVVPAQAKSSSPNALVPFVGCDSDGQMGPQKAPKGNSRSFAIRPDVAKQLAYYKMSEGYGVLAPRGWKCFGAYGSNGDFLIIAPEQVASAEVLSDKWGGLTGFGVQLSFSFGDTSGRFEVARVIARIFPDRKSFTEDVIAEGIEPASDFPFGPFPNDKIIHRNKDTVEYETPANSEGLGTMSRLKKNDMPIRGIAMLTGETPDLVMLAVRLQKDQSDLTPAIISQVEGPSQSQRKQGN